MVDIYMSYRYILPGCQSQKLPWPTKLLEGNHEILVRLLLRENSLSYCFKSCTFVSASVLEIRLAPGAWFFSSILPESVHWPLEYQGAFFKAHAVSQACLLHFSLFIRGGDGEVGSLLALTYEWRLHYETGAVCSPQRLGFSMVHAERMK